MSDDTQQRMRDDWNQRAREDANYYVAFGRKGQRADEFFDSATEMVRSFEDELRRLPPRLPRARRALEIGCGPGRLMRPLSRHFGEIHGVDVSDEMVMLATKNLADIPHARPHHTATSDLSAFADSSFDFVYSYAVFQHIPDREVVFRYFSEAKRVLRAGGIARFQINGLPETAARYDTWSGVRISAPEVAEFTRDNDFQLLALEGIATQYMWTTWRKRPAGWGASLHHVQPAPKAHLYRITNTFSSEPVAPTRGRFASISLWLEGLPEECDLNYLAVQIGGEEALATFIGPPENDGFQQVNAYLPQGLATGLQPLTLRWLGRDLCPPATLRVVPPGPAIPRISNISDGVNLLSGKKIVSGSVKIVLEEVDRPQDLVISLAGETIPRTEVFCTDPRVPIHEVNFDVPATVPSGSARLELSLGKRRFAPVSLDLA